jgi:hypothetical protein
MGIGIMIEIPIKISDAKIEQILDVIYGHTNVVLTEQQLAEFLLANQHVVSEILSFGLEDTETEAKIISALARHVGMIAGWPCNGDGEEYYVQYFDAFKKLCRAKGYEVK